MNEQCAQSRSFDTVELLKERVNGMSGVPEAAQRLIYKVRENYILSGSHKMLSKFKNFKDSCIETDCIYDIYS